MTLMVHEGTIGKSKWRSYCIVTDNRVAIVDMTPAMYGWNIGKVTIQGEAEWLGRKESSIVAFKLENGSARLTSKDEIGADFLPKLLTAAGLPCDECGWPHVGPGHVDA